MLIPGEQDRKNKDSRREALNLCDIALLCLPDEAAREAAGMVQNPETIVIDASSAHRTEPGWTYGLPELSGSMEDQIRPKRITLQAAMTLPRLSIHCGNRVIQRISEHAFP